MVKPKPKRPSEEQKKTEKTKVELKRRIPQEFQDFGESKINCIYNPKAAPLQAATVHDRYMLSIRHLKCCVVLSLQPESLCVSPQANTHERLTFACKSVRTPPGGDVVLIVTGPSRRTSCWLRPRSQLSSTFDL